ncbi:unnamed protein product [Lepidochelys olivacea]
MPRGEEAGSCAGRHVTHVQLDSALPLSREECFPHGAGPPAPSVPAVGRHPKEKGLKWGLGMSAWKGIWGPFACARGCHHPAMAGPAPTDQSRGENPGVLAPRPRCSNHQPPLPSQSRGENPGILAPSAPRSNHQPPLPSQSPQPPTAPGVGGCARGPPRHLGWGDAPGAPHGTAGGGEEERERDVCSAENASLFSSFQDVAVGLAFAKGRPFRQPPRPTLTCSPSEWRVALVLGHFLEASPCPRLTPALPQVRFLLGSAPDDARPSPEPPAPHSPPVVAPGGAEAPRAKTGLGGAGGDLAAPQLLTSLALGEEVQTAARQGFDAHRAAQELLATSFLARCSVEGKAAAGMNIPREQQLYQGLVSLQVPAEEVLSSALQEKLSLVRSQPEPHREPDPEGPDLLMFYEPLELFAETPYLGVEGLPPLRLQPHVRPPASAFLMFRKLQQWEA